MHRKKQTLDPRLRSAFGLFIPTAFLGAAIAVAPDIKVASVTTPPVEAENGSEIFFPAASGSSSPPIFGSND